MYTLKDNEKATAVILYTPNGLLHGKAITMKIVRVNIWLRTDNAPKYIHLLDAQMISVTGASGSKSIKLKELFVPTEDVIAYHVAPGVEIQLDYNENELNRRMLPVRAISSSMFVFDGEARISTQTEFGVSLEVGRTQWMSLYNIRVSHPSLPNMNLASSMALLRPKKFSFGEIL